MVDKLIKNGIIEAPGLTEDDIERMLAGIDPNVPVYESSEKSQVSTFAYYTAFLSWD